MVLLYRVLFCNFANSSQFCKTFLGLISCKCCNIVFFLYLLYVVCIFSSCKCKYCHWKCCNQINVIKKKIVCHDLSVWNMRLKSHLLSINAEPSRAYSTQQIKNNFIGISSILGWSKSRVGLPPPFIAMLGQNLNSDVKKITKKIIRRNVFEQKKRKPG